MSDQSIRSDLSVTADQAIVQPRPFQFRIAERQGLLMFSDLIANFVAVVFALWFWGNLDRYPFTVSFVQNHWHWVLFLPIFWFFLAQVNEYYLLRVAARISFTLSRASWISLQFLFVYLAIFFAAPRDLLPRVFVLSYSIAALVLVILFRLTRIAIIRTTGSHRRVLMVGTGDASDAVRTAIEGEMGGDYRIVGSVISEEDAHLVPVGKEILGHGRDIINVIHQYHISEIVIAYVNEMPADIFKGVIDCYERNIPIVSMPDLYEQITGRVPIDQIGEHLWAQVLPRDNHTLSFNFFQIVKRVTDIVFAVVGLILFAIIFPFLALVIKLDSPGPIFFSQIRLGRGGRPFRCLKLRTMVSDAEKKTGAVWAKEKDSRITRVGNVLRKTRLDEIPQLVNVLRGEMSVVGPRPERPEFYNLLSSQIPFYRSRLVVKPGLTGWAQIRYRYGSSVEDALVKLQYDLYYIRHQSILMDFLIMVRTIRTMMMFEGR